MDFPDLAKRLDSKDTNKRVIESLIKCGAFDEISENRASLMAGYENVLDSISMDRKKNIQGQISLFDAFGGSEENNLQQDNSIPKLPEYAEREKLSLDTFSLPPITRPHTAQTVIVYPSLSKWLDHQQEESHARASITDDQATDQIISYPGHNLQSNTGKRTI